MQRTFLTRLPGCLAVCALLWTAATFSFAQIQPQDRIVQEIDHSQMTALQGNIHPLARAQYDQGSVSPGMQLEGMSLVFKLSASQQAALQELLQEQQDPSSPNYRKWLTPEQYGARFGMSQHDLDRVTAWLQSQGFTGIQVSRGRSSVFFNGTAAQVGAAFHTELHNYLVNGRMHFANATAPSVPTAFAGTLLAIHHLNNFRPQPRAHLRTVPASARFTSSVSGNHYLSPGDFATIYDLGPLYSAGLDGTGISIAVVGQTEIDPNDISTFRSLSGLSANPPQLILVPNTGASVSGDPGDIQESDLDIEWSGGVAKNANVIFVYAGSQGSAFDALQYAIDNKIAPVIGISYGNCEQAFAPSDIATLQSWVNQAIAQGQTISAASGDAGAADCEDASSTSATTGLAIDVPGAFPEVVSVGGTEFTGDNTTGADAPYWAAATSSSVDNISSALEYIPEMAWNDSPVTGTGTQLATTLSAGGGGVSTLFAKPAWQTALTPADGQRDVPDVSFNASPAHDGYLVCSQGSCVSGFRATAGGNLTVFGGTSVSAQVFAGVLAILNQATQSGGLGNMNARLYTLPYPGTAFHDITSGSNIVPCTSGTPTTGPAALRCPTAAPFQIGYSAKTGYDLATGLGSVDVNRLVTAWPGFTGAASYSVDATPVTITSAGGSGTSTVTVSSTTGFVGTVTLSCTPPAGTTAQIGCSFTSPTSGSTTSVALSSSTTSAMATLSVTSAAAHAVKSTTTADASRHGRLGWFTASGGVFFAGIFLLGTPMRRRWAAVLGLMFCVFLAVGVGCGGSSGSTTPTPTPTPTTTATPSFSPAPGTVTSGTKVTLSDTTSGATIYCTTDGTTPSPASSSVCTSVTVTSTTTINAIASSSSLSDSPVATGAYTVSGNPGTPAGTYVVAVTATSGTVSHTTNVTVTVQ